MGSLSTTGTAPTTPAGTSPRYLPRYLEACLQGWVDYESPDGETPMGWRPDEWAERADPRLVAAAVQAAAGLLQTEEALNDQRLPAATRRRLEMKRAALGDGARGAFEVVLARGLARRCGRFLRPLGDGLLAFARLTLGHEEAEPRDDLAAWVELTVWLRRVGGDPGRVRCELYGSPVHAALLHVCAGCTAVFSGRAGAGRCHLCKRRPPANDPTVAEIAEVAVGQRPAVSLPVAKHHPRISTLVTSFERVTLRACAECGEPMMRQRADAAVCSKACEGRRLRREA